MSLPVMLTCCGQTVESPRGPVIDEQQHEPYLRFVRDHGYHGIWGKLTRRVQPPEGWAVYDGIPDEVA